MQVSALSPGRLQRRWRVALVAVYLAVILPALMFFNVGLTPDSLAVILLGAALLVGRPAMFLRDWGVFLVVLIAWQQTGPVAKWAGFPLHLAPLVDADRAIAWPLLHGQLPQVWLQDHLLHGTWAQVPKTPWRIVLNNPHWQWYDVLSWAVYGLHFPAPLIIGFAIWLRTREGFRRFATAYLVLAALAFVGYIIYPAIPPWMAANPYYAAKDHFHAIPLVGNVFDSFNTDVLLGQFKHHYKYVLHVDYNLTAAMPSLHAAFPLLCALYLRKTFGNWGLLMVAYAAVVWFAVVYMAEHWVIDVLVGLVCTAIAYALVEGVAWAWARRGARGRRTGLADAEAGTAAAFSREAGAGR